MASPSGSATPQRVAITGASGFLGRHLLRALDRPDVQLRLLLRRDPAELTRGLTRTPEIVPGALADVGALRRLVTDADVVIHLAGAIKAGRDADYFVVNRDGAQALATAVREAGAAVRHLVQVSSLAARHPELSPYAASKRAGEDAMRAVLGAARLSVVRPPAIYGPGDRETMVFFDLARRARVPIPGRPEARLALIHVEDAARWLAARALGAPTGRIEAIADGNPAGYRWQQIFAAAAAGMGNARPTYWSLPPALLRGVGGGAAAIAALTGRSGMVSAGKIRELLHEDWAVAESELVPIPGVQSRHALDAGFAETARWYLQAGWL